MKRGIAGLALATALGLTGTAQAEEKPNPPDPSLEFVFEEEVMLASGIAPGTTPLGGRNIIPITGGTFSGPAIRGTVMPGGWDWQLIRPDGCVQLKADYFIKTDDGVVINIVNTAVACRDGQGKPGPVRTHAVFEAPNGKYDWLNRETFIGSLVPGDASLKSVRIRFYRVN
ncbi:DUF3237 domain-containing protein [Novosphingobium taihuense]|uniref:UPF0311 protein GGR37_003126 n=1 Tax=Novosphingobium taihuense TaxID=260085 RepID=A0A7W7EVA5_9SPHN|nr:DUF3237 domain-containing protein [Novosphingobium taihuense]MBB4614836.1 hypothetical protein [Novosphingobium taihuense]TWH84722.1 uncharacterized protein DUF3237 [Novosphingobium taihuense]